MERTTYPLTFGQKVVGYAGKLFPKGAVNNIGGLLLLEDELDFELLQKAIKLCVARNDALRLRMVNSDDDLDLVTQYFVLGTVRQYVTDEPAADIPLVDFSGKTQQEMDEQILGWNRVPIDVFHEPLYQFTMVKACDGRQGVFSKIDHLATDAWMSVMIGVEIIEVYYALKRGEELPKPAYPFLDTIAEELAYLDSQKFRDDESFWLSLYEKDLPFTFINTPNEYPVSLTGSSNRKTALMDSGLSVAVKEFCKNHSISPANFFETVLGIYLYRLRNSQDVLLGSTTILRSTLREKRTCGCLVNNLNVRLFLDENKPFAEVCSDSNLQQLSMVRHMRYPQLVFMMNVYSKHGTRSLWDCGIAYHVAHVQTRETVPCQLTWYSSGSFAMPLYINVTDLDNADRYLLYYEYQTEPFSVERIDEINSGLQSIIQRGIERPDVLLKHL